MGSLPSLSGERITEPIHFDMVTEPINGKPEGKNILSMRQFSEEDICLYLEESYAAEQIF